MNDLLNIKYPFKPSKNFIVYNFFNNIEQILSFFVNFYNLKEEDSNSFSQIYKNVTKNRIISALENNFPIYYVEHIQQIIIQNNFSKIIKHIVKCKGKNGMDYIFTNQIIFVRNTCNGNIIGYIEDKCPIIHNKNELINYMIFKGYLNDINRKTIFKQIEKYSKKNIIKKNIFHSITIKKNISEVYKFFQNIENIYIVMNLNKGHKFIQKGIPGNIGMKYYIINLIKNFQIIYTVVNISDNNDFKFIKFSKKTNEGPCFNEYLDFSFHEISEDLTWISVDNNINSCCENYKLNYLNKYVNYYLRKIKEFLEM
jgi:hypothetical protein